MKAKNVFYIEYAKEKRNTAGSKAPDDIGQICKARGYKRILMPAFPSKKNSIYKKLWLLTVGNHAWANLKKILPDGSIVIYQHPAYGKRIIFKYVRELKKHNKCKFIAVIHDLESLRGGIAGVITNHQKTNEIGDNVLLKTFDAVVCHNEHMRKYMIAQGFDADKLINLDIFDYLSDCKREQPQKREKPSIAIAGNLAIGKCGYIYDICRNGKNQNLEINLYGNNFQADKIEANMIYHGSFKPEELPVHLIGDFGLIWDGVSAETCAGNTGEYLKYNNPHKTSLYLSSGMPVVVWSQAAIADFVLENGVGITVDSLYELEDAIRCITENEYCVMCDKVKAVGEKLRNGYYTQYALEQSLAIVNH